MRAVVCLCALCVGAPPPCLEGERPDPGSSSYGRVTVNWVLLVPVAVFLIRRSPESVGLRPDGLTAGGAGVSVEAQPGQVEGWMLGEAGRTMAFWLVMVTAALTNESCALLTRARPQRRSLPAADAESDRLRIAV